MRIKALSGIAALALFSGACIGGSGGVASVFSVTSLEGKPEGRFAAQSAWRPLIKGEEVPAGTVIRLLQQADVVTLGRGSGVEVEIRANEAPPEDEIAAEAVVASAGEILVRTGDVLARTDSDVRLTLRSETDGVSASGATGAFRLDRRTSLRVGVYAGETSVTGPEGSAAIPGLREARPSNGAPGAPMPLRISDGDPWDARFLADALEVDRGIAAAIAGYEGEFGARMRSVAELRVIAVDARRADVGFVAGTIQRFGAGDVLVGAVLALHLESGGRGSAPTLFAQMIRQKELGASWGLIAAGYGIDAAQTLAVVTRAVGLRTGVVRPGSDPVPPPSPGPSGRPSVKPSNRPTPKPSPSPSTSRRPTPTPTPTPSASATPSPTETPCSSVDALLGRC